jgi:hypothetical protein
MPSTSKKQRNFMAAAAHNPAFAKKVGISQKVAKEFNTADKGKKFGTGGDVSRTIGGQNQINKQRTRFGSTLGYEKNVPNINLNKYIGKKEGGVMKSESKKEMREEMKVDTTQDKKLIKRAFGMHDKQQHEAKKTNLSKLKGGGMARMKEKGEHPVQKQSKRGAEVVKMRKGGKCYDEGGEIEFETKTGRNENIGDDVRARAMAALEKGISSDTAAEKSMTKAAPSLPTRKAFVSKANKAGFAADQTGGGAALMTRKDRKMAKGGTASSRGDGIASKGKTRGKMC